MDAVSASNTIDRHFNTGTFIYSISWFVLMIPKTHHKQSYDTTHTKGV